jgi:hypothetical protein
MLSIYSRQGRLCPLVGLIFFWYFSHNVISERANAVYEFSPFRLELGEPPAGAWGPLRRTHRKRI